METINTWLFVDIQGNEFVSNIKPVRKKVTKSGFVKITFCYTEPNKWCHPWQQEEQLFIEFKPVMLPKGSIEFLTGKKMCFLNDPIKINLHIKNTHTIFAK